MVIMTLKRSTGIMRSTFLNDGSELPRGSGHYRVVMRIKRGSNYGYHR